MTERQSEIIRLIRKEVKPALGCTEPIAVALAVAKAMEIYESQTGTAPGWRLTKDYSLDVKVSGNILKNGMGVGIPGTGMVGLHIAASLGAVCGKDTLVPSVTGCLGYNVSDYVSTIFCIVVLLTY